jgi:hypothetical protein
MLTCSVCCTRYLMQLLLIVVVVIVFTTTVYEKFSHTFLMSEITSTLLSEAVMYRSWNPGFSSMAKM